MNIYTSLKYDSPELIIAERHDGTKFTIEPTDGTMWSEAIAGVFGPIAPYVPPPEPDPILVWRSNVYLTRQEFCLALFDNNVLPHSEAMEAVKGDWPASFDAALTGRDDADRIRIVWAGAQTIGRNHPLILMLQAFSLENETIPPLTDEFVDQLFGWTND